MHFANRAYVVACFLFSSDPPTKRGQLAQPQFVEDKLLEVNQWCLMSNIISKVWTVFHISIANLKQHDENIGDCDADGHDKDKVVEDEDLREGTKSDPKTTLIPGWQSPCS